MRSLLLGFALTIGTLGCGDDDDLGDGLLQVDSGPGMSDAAIGGPDAGLGDAGSSTDGAVESNEDAAIGAECGFNRDCPASARCECEETSGCACAVGTRGTGISGVDTCETGDECASALCVEGPENDDAFYCSDECGSDDDCTGALPRCLDIAFVGRICAREAP